MKRLLGFALASLLTLGLAGSAFATSLCGTVYCGEGNIPTSGIVVQVQSATFTHAAVTDGSGNYCIELPYEFVSYVATLLLYNGETIISPASGSYQFSIDENNLHPVRDWVIDAPSCGGKQEEGACWLTGGGAKFSPLTDILLAESGKWNNFGGNVNPGCSPTAGDGGNWNHIANQLNLHFQGRHIEVIRCGNVDDIPPGSESPVTPFNFIEFSGTGRVQGVKGNKADYPEVYFFGRCEDRNEPGSNGQRDGAFKDRYFLHVYSSLGDPFGSTIILVDVDGNPATVDPITITDGNLQIHISSCDSPPSFAAQRGSGSETNGSLVPADIKRRSWGAVKSIYR